MWRPARPARFWGARFWRTPTVPALNSPMPLHAHLYALTCACVHAHKPIPRAHALATALPTGGPKRAAPSPPHPCAVQVLINTVSIRPAPIYMLEAFLPFRMPRAQLSRFGCGPGVAASGRHAAPQPRTLLLLLLLNVTPALLAAPAAAGEPPAPPAGTFTRTTLAHAGWPCRCCRI